MKLDHYTLESGRRLYTYEFTSVGPKGNIPKLIQFTVLVEENSLYNLAFGDLNKETGEIPAVRINPELDKYDNIVLFPKKVEKAKEAFAKQGVPDFIKQRKR